jgi:hypothetical protein
MAEARGGWLKMLLPLLAVALLFGWESAAPLRTPAPLSATGAAPGSGGAAAAAAPPAAVKAILAALAACPDSPATADALRSAMATAVAARRHANGIGGEPFSLGSLAAVHRCARLPAAAPLALRDVVFVLMAGSVKRERLVAIRETWGKHVPAGRLLVVGDVNDPSVGMITLPGLEGKAS